MCQGIVIQSKLVPINIGLTPDHFLSIQDRQPICELPGDVRNDQSEGCTQQSAEGPIPVDIDFDIVEIVFYRLDL